jgi:hypothetical protein
MMSVKVLHDPLSPPAYAHVVVHARHDGRSEKAAVSWINVRGRDAGPNFEWPLEKAIEHAQQMATAAGVRAVVVKRKLKGASAR